MNPFFFWKSWPQPVRWLTHSFLFLLLISASFFVYQYAIEGNAITWETDPELRPVKTTFDHFEQHGFTFDLQQYAFVVNDYFIPKGPYLQATLSYGLLIVAALCLILLFTYISGLDTFWYFVFSGAGILLLAVLNPEASGALGRSDKLFTVIVIVAFTGTSYLFQSWRDRLSLLLRFGGFVVVSALLGLIVLFTSNEAMPFVLLINYGIMTFFILTLFFFLITGDIMIYGFLFLTTSGKTNKPFHNFYYFLATSLLYLSSLLLCFLQKWGYTDWGVIISPYLLFAVSAFAGFWAFKRKSDLLPKELAYAPYGVLLYLALATISFATIGYFIATDNDMMTAILEEAIIYAHLPLGLMFMIYCVYNFYHLFKIEKKIYQFAYKPQRMPYAALFAFGLVCVVAFVLRGGKYHPHRIMSGYYIAVADGYRIAGDNVHAREYYKQAKNYYYGGYRANFSLAQMEEAEERIGESTRLLEHALQKSKSAELYAKLGKNYLDQNRYFYALFKVREGAEQLPGNGYLHNNLGLLYGKGNMLDSALYHLGQAKKTLSQNREAAASNLLSILVEKGHLEVADSLLAAHDPADRKAASPWTINELAQLAKTSDPGQLPGFDKHVLRDSLLTRYTFMYINNYLLADIKNADSTQLARIKKIAGYPGNRLFNEDLEWLAALAGYYRGNTFPAMKWMHNIQTRASSLADVYNHILGLLFYRQGLPEKALHYLQYAYEKGYEPALYHYPLILSEHGNRSDALKLWHFTGKTTKTDSLRNLSVYMERVMTASPDSVLSWNDTDKYRFIVYNLSRLSETNLLRVQHAITDTVIQKNTGLFIAGQLLDAGYPDKAAALLSHTGASGLTASQHTLFQELQLRTYLTGGGSPLRKKDLERIRLPKEKDYLVNYAWGKFYEQTAPEKALGYYRQAIDRFLVCEEGLPGAVHALNEAGDAQQAYDLLIDALRWKPDSKALNKAFCLQCLEVGLEEEAEKNLNELRELLDPEAFAAFEVLYNEKQERLQEDWDMVTF